MTYTITRPLMDAAELRTHQADSYGRDYRVSDDGYGDVEAEGRSGWQPVAGWGRDGWDLGDWPYVTILVRIVTPGTDGKLARSYDLMQICEGDRTVYTFDNLEDQQAAIDYLFLWYAAGKRWAPLGYEDRAALDAGTLRVDEMFRGPYRARS